MTTDTPVAGTVDSSGHVDGVGAMHLLPPELPSHPPSHPSPPMRDAFYTPPCDLEDFSHDIIHLDDDELTEDFIKSRQSTASNYLIGFSSEAVKRLRNPPHGQPTLSIDKGTCLAIDLYLVNSSEETYMKNRRSISRCYSGINLPTYYETKRLVADLTGIEPVVHHMCPNLCIMYAGPFLGLDVCPNCSEPRYDQFWLQASSGKEKVPRQEFRSFRHCTKN